MMERRTRINNHCWPQRGWQKPFVPHVIDSKEQATTRCTYIENTLKTILSHYLSHAKHKVSEKGVIFAGENKL